MTLAYMISEVKRAVHNRRIVIFGLTVPVFMMLLFGSAKAQLGGLAIGAFYMVSMATFGAMNMVMSAGGRVAFERSIGWNRQLRLTALSGRAYVIGKLATGYVIAAGSVIAMFLVAGLVDHIRLSGVQWVETAAVILVSLIPVGLFGVAAGYLAKPDNMQVLTGTLFTILSLIGGIWFPLSEEPGWMQSISKASPVTWTASAGRDVITHTWIGWEGIFVLVAWTIGLTALAAWGYRRDTFRA